MKKVAVFGKPGSGKSILSRDLAATTGIPLHQLDSIVFHKNGDRVNPEIFKKAHEEILDSESWIIDGLGPLKAFHKRLEAADTLIYIDLPYPISYWFVTKRLLRGLVVKPEGWPDGSSVIKGTWNSYKVLKLCPDFWNDEFLQQLQTLSAGRSLHIIRSVPELNNFTSTLERER